MRSIELAQRFSEKQVVMTRAPHVGVNSELQLLSFEEGRQMRRQKC